MMTIMIMSIIIIMEKAGDKATLFGSLGGKARCDRSSHQVKPFEGHEVEIEGRYGTVVAS